MHGLFKHKDTAYVKWLKEQLDRNETRETLIAYQNDIRQFNERVNYQNQVDRMMSQVQRDNLPGTIVWNNYRDKEINLKV